MGKSKKIFCFKMLGPSLLILTFLSVFPLLFIMHYSFTDYYFLAKTKPLFIGLENFTKILNDTYFRQAIYNTVRFTALAVIFETILGTLAAIFINSIVKGKRILRTLVLLPTLLPPVTVALIWQTMFSNNSGIINEFLNKIGIAPVNWLMDTRTAFYAILTIDIWQYAPLVFLLVFAALQSVPQGQYEAAKIDGANGWHRFIYITIPNITNVMAMVVLLRVIDSFRLFDKVNILTKGGPANSTATITQFIYQYGVKGLQVGYGSAASMIMTLIVLVLAFFYIKKSFKEDNIAAEVAKEKSVKDKTRTINDAGFNKSEKLETA